MILAQIGKKALRAFERNNISGCYVATGGSRCGRLPSGIPIAEARPERSGNRFPDPDRCAFSCPGRLRGVFRRSAPGEQSVEARPVGFRNPLPTPHMSAFLLQPDESDHSGGPRSPGHTIRSAAEAGG